MNDSTSVNPQSPDVGTVDPIVAPLVPEYLTTRAKDRQRVAEAGLANVDVILGRFEDPLLPDGGVDLVLIVDTYHHLEDRPAYFRNLRRDLAPGGRIAVIDYDGRKGWFVRLMGHTTPREELLREMAEAGYEVAQEFDFIDRQSFVIFRPASRASLRACRGLSSGFRASRRSTPAA